MLNRSGPAAGSNDSVSISEALPVITSSIGALSPDRRNLSLTKSELDMKTFGISEVVS